MARWREGREGSLLYLRSRERREVRGEREEGERRVREQEDRFREVREGREVNTESSRLP